MKKIIIFAMFFVCANTHAESYEELMALLTANQAPRVETGVIREIDLANRILLISGYEYAAAPATAADQVDVHLIGTAAGSLELLKLEMPVEIEYYEFNIGRVVLSITEIDDDLEIEF